MKKITVKVLVGNRVKPYKPSEIAGVRKALKESAFWKREQKRQKRSR